MLTVYCLCAAWCTTCTAFRPQFDELATLLAAGAPGTTVRWVDIEDESDVVDPVEVETFPTVLIVRDGAPVFFGPVRPQRAAVQRLLDGTDPGDAGPLPPDVWALASRLLAREPT